MLFTVSNDIMRGSNLISFYTLLYCTYILLYIYSHHSDLLATYNMNEVVFVKISYFKDS